MLILLPSLSLFFFIFNEVFPFLYGGGWERRVLRFSSKMFERLYDNSANSLVCLLLLPPLLLL